MRRNASAASLKLARDGLEQIFYLNVEDLSVRKATPAAISHEAPLPSIYLHEQLNTGR
jgi:hypothetical protein